MCRAYIYIDRNRKRTVTAQKRRRVCWTFAHLSEPSCTHHQKLGGSDMSLSSAPFFDRGWSPSECRSTNVRVVVFFFYDFRLQNVGDKSWSDELHFPFRYRRDDRCPLCPIFRRPLTTCASLARQNRRINRISKRGRRRVRRHFLTTGKSSHKNTFQNNSIFAEEFAL